MTSRKDNEIIGVAPRSMNVPEQSDEYNDDWVVKLTDVDPSERATAAFTLGGPVRDRETVIKALRSSLMDADPEVGEFAAASLAMHGDQGSIDRIIETLPTGPPRDRRNAAWAIAELAPHASDAVRMRAMAALAAYHKRARGSSRNHAAVLLARLAHSQREAT